VNLIVEGGALSFASSRSVSFVCSSGMICLQNVSVLIHIFVMIFHPASKNKVTETDSLIRIQAIFKNRIQNQTPGFAEPVSHPDP
jgi:hypothetical protein